MISMTNLTIPTLGMFSTGVFVCGDRYSGTWQHGKFCGYMYGRIQKADE